MVQAHLAECGVAHTLPRTPVIKVRSTKRVVSKGVAHCLHKDETLKVVQRSDQSGKELEARQQTAAWALASSWGGGGRKTPDHVPPERAG